MSSPDSSTQPAAKRQRTEQKRMLKELSAEQFASKTSLYSGPTVTITAGGKDFILPKALLCYNSPFFEKAFNGNFREAKEQKMTLTDCSSEIFEFVIQWIFHCQVVLPGTQETEPMFDTQATAKYAGLITKLLAFLKLSDEIQLLGPFSQVIKIMTTIVVASRTSLQSSHIRTAFEFPSAHPTRKLFAQACVKEYAVSFFKKPATKTKDFRFKKDLDECDAFAAALLTEFAEMFRGRSRRTGCHEQRTVEMKDPLSGESFHVS